MLLAVGPPPQVRRGNSSERKWTEQKSFLMGFIVQIELLDLRPAVLTVQEASLGTSKDNIAESPNQVIIIFKIGFVSFAIWQLRPLTLDSTTGFMYQGMVEEDPVDLARTSGTQTSLKTSQDMLLREITFYLETVPLLTQ